MLPQKKTNQNLKLSVSYEYLTIFRYEKVADLHSNVQKHEKYSHYGSQLILNEETVWKNIK